MPHDNLVEISLPPVAHLGYLFRIEPRECASSFEWGCWLHRLMGGQEVSLTTKVAVGAESI